MPHSPCNQPGLHSKTDGCQASNSSQSLLDDDPQQTATAQHERVKGTSNAAFLRGKSNGVLHNCVSSHKGDVRDHDQQTELLPSHAEIIPPQQHDHAKRSRSRESLHAKYNYFPPDNHHVCFSEDDRHVEHNTDDEFIPHEANHAKHSSKTRDTIMASTLQAARTNAAELRALHSAVLNGHISLANDVRDSMERQWHPMPVNSNLAHYRTRANKERHNHDFHPSTFGAETKEDVLSRPSSISSTSSTADCFIRSLHEYPVFTPHSREDMQLTTIMDDIEHSNRCSSVDPYEAAMQEERLQYIFDHDNKRNFSHSYLNHPHAGKNRLSCLHESLNLPPRSALALMQARSNDDQQMQHMSLNLPPGSQQHLFEASMQNPLFESHENVHINQKPSHDLGSGSASSLSFKKYNVDMDDAATRKQSADLKHVRTQEDALHDLTTRQRALIEFLSEEPGRMRAFNELAARQPATRSEANLSKSKLKDIQEDIVAAASKLKNIQEEDISAAGSSKGTQNFAAAACTADQNQGRADHQHHAHQKPHNSGLVSHQRLSHASRNDHFHQPSSIVSCDKCRPALSGVAAPRPDTPEIGTVNASPSAVMTNGQDHLKKHSSIKDWFFRSKKKDNSRADHWRSRVASGPIDSTLAGKSQSVPITSSLGKCSASEGQVGAAPTNAAPTSRVFSSVVTSDTVKDLEVAMAMDLMELKVLQANTKRDAAMAEVLELRLAIDSMAKVLVEVERHCESLQSQLQCNHAPSARHSNGTPVNQWVHQSAAKEKVTSTSAAADYSDRGGNGPITGEEDDFCESDSHGRREERKVDSSNVGSGVNAQRHGYGGGSISRRQTRPKKEEFLGAVAEARVVVKQVSRVILQHVQERMTKGAAMEMNGGEEAEPWRPIVTMCREASKTDKDGRGSTSRGREVSFCIEALVSLAFYEHFENVGFNKSGAHHILDPVQRATAFYHGFLKLAKVTPTQLLTQISPVYNPSFDRFCSRKMKAVGRAVGCPGRLWPDELARCFLSAARAVWLLHLLAFSYSDCAPAIFRVAAESAFDRRFMELLPTIQHHHHQPHQRLVSLMVVPGFFLFDDVIKCKVLAY